MTTTPPPGGRPCLVCGKPTEAYDRNADGTYAHRDCLLGKQTKHRVNSDDRRD